MPVTVLDIEQHLLLLELEAPFDKRDVQLARRRMAKRWHPDVAPQGRQFEHERHLKAIDITCHESLLLWSAEADPENVRSRRLQLTEDIFFLFTREITRFVQFIVLAVLIAVVFYTPNIVQLLATGIANALGVH